MEELLEIPRQHFKARYYYTDVRLVSPLDGKYNSSAVEKMLQSREGKHVDRLLIPLFPTDSGDEATLEVQSLEAAMAVTSTDLVAVDEEDQVVAVVVEGAWV